MYLSGLIQRAAYAILAYSIVYEKKEKIAIMRFLYRLKQLILLCGDLASYAVALWASVFVRNLSIPASRDIERQIPLFSITFFLWVVLNYTNGLYDLGMIAKKTTGKRFLQTAVVALALSVAFFYLIPNPDISPKTILLFTVMLGFGISALWRVVYRTFFVGKKSLYTNVILVGYTDEARELVEILREYPEKGYKIKAIIDPDNHVKPVELPGIDVYHGLHTIRPAITNTHAHMVAIAPHLREHPNALRELYELLFWKVRITDLPSFYELLTGRVPPSTFSEGWFLDHLRNKEQPVYTKFRTMIDYVAGTIMAVIFLALFPFIALAIKLNSKGPLFIRQERIGQFGNIFTLYKFRSMYALSADGTAETQGVQFAKKNDERITAVGAFLRKTRLDELPQFLNLFSRDLTFIGPRPERPEIVKTLAARMPYYPLRHIIKPGLTGWAAIQQHYTDTLETSLQKLQYDFYYIKNRSLLLDIAILLRTVNVVVRMMGQ